MPSSIIKSKRFEAIAVSESAGTLLKVRILEKGRTLSFTEVLDLWESDSDFVDLIIATFKQSGFHGYIWETPAVSSESKHRRFEFIIHNWPHASGLPDHQTFADYFDTETAAEGIVAFENLGRDALLIVPSPYRETADYSGLAEFFREAPFGQQRGLWRALGRQAKSRLSDRPMWLSVAGGGIQWLHIRLDSTPKYYRYGSYRSPD
ncbi:MAG: hypothetical protein AAF495_03310 [Pseudomonadota bacterium]